MNASTWLRGVTWNGIQFVIVGEWGTILYSVQESTPQLVTAPPDVGPVEATGIDTPVNIGIAMISDDVVSLSNDAPVFGFSLDTTVVTWTAIDAAGNVGTDTQNVTVQDTTSPVVTAPADVGPVEATGTTTPVAIGTATATDAVGIVSIGNNAPASFPLGITVVTWTATDTSGNTGTATQNVTVQDTTAPTLTVLGSNPITVEGGTPYNDAGATATDSVDGDLSAGIIVGGLPIDTSVAGTYTVTYNVTDSSGNAAAQVTRTVNVVDSKPGIDIVMNLPSGVSVFFNNNSSSVTLHGDTAEAIATADVDNNGVDDVIVSFPAGTGPDGNGGTYISRNQDPLTVLDNRTAEQIAVGDFDGNGQVDLLFGFETDGLWARMNDTDAILLINLLPVAMAAGDIDNNGQDDIALSLEGMGTLSLLNFGSIIFYDGDAADTLSIADVDNNGEGDVIASFPAGSGPDGTGGLYFARNQGNLNFFTDIPAEQISEGDYDGNGQNDLLLDLGTAGLWIWANDISATLITPVSPTAMATGNLDNNSQDDMVLSFDGVGTISVKDLATIETLDPGVALNLAHRQHRRELNTASCE